MFAKASLPMYDWPELRAATDAFWVGLAPYARVSGVLDRRGRYDQLWRDPALIFSQTCGYPFTHEYAGVLKYVATPHYAADGCDAANYSSLIFAREALRPAQFEHAKPAVNSLDSMSGMLALKLVFAAHPRALAAPLMTGSHMQSMAAVQAGIADVCAIDAVVVAMARIHRPQLLAGLFEIARSPKVPGLPFVTRSANVVILQDALHKVFADPALAKVLGALLLTGFSILPDDAYTAIERLDAQL